MRKMQDIKAWYTRMRELPANLRREWQTWWNEALYSADWEQATPTTRWQWTKFFVLEQYRFWRVYLPTTVVCEVFGHRLVEEVLNRESGQSELTCRRCNWSVGYYIS